MNSSAASLKHAVAGVDLWQWWQWARQQAQAGNVDPAEADWFLRAMSDLDSLALKLGTFRQRPSVLIGASLEDMTERWRQRIEERVPVQYLVGFTTWRDLTIRVSPAVLIPRPETELLIDLAVSAVNQSPDAERLRRGIWVDLGTGSGAIALGLAQALPEAQIFAIDISEAALTIARENAHLNGLEQRITFCCGSWFTPLKGCQGQLAGVVSNPPYIPTETVKTLEPEVVNHEPSLALDGGEDGLEAIRTLSELAPDQLSPGGLWLVEMMAGQADTIKALLLQQGAYDKVQIHADLAGIERFGLAFRK
ncbi:MAG TPA: peptide chain release factor N(5)-glutamine methyltransferase [Leptolyngbyaceae cyanobacterium]